MDVIAFNAAISACTSGRLVALSVPFGQAFAAPKSKELTDPEFLLPSKSGLYYTIPQLNRLSIATCCFIRVSPRYEGKKMDWWRWSGILMVIMDIVRICQNDSNKMITIIGMVVVLSYHSELCSHCCEPQENSSETHEHQNHSAVSNKQRKNVWWTDSYVENMAKTSHHICRSMGCCPVPFEWDHPETTSGHCEPWKQLIGLRARAWYTKGLERGWVAATIWYHSIHEWTGTKVRLLHIHIFLFVETSKSCHSEQVKYAEDLHQFCSTDFRRTFPSYIPGCEHVGQTLLRISFTSCISTFERASPPWQVALALLQEMFHCGLRPSIVTYNSAISVARTWMRTQQCYPFKRVVWRSVFQFT